MKLTKVRINYVAEEGAVDYSVLLDDEALVDLVRTIDGLQEETEDRDDQTD